MVLLIDSRYQEKVGGKGGPDFMNTITNRGKIVKPRYSLGGQYSLTRKLFSTMCFFNMLSSPPYNSRGRSVANTLFDEKLRNPKMEVVWEGVGVIRTLNNRSVVKN